MQNTPRPRLGIVLIALAGLALATFNAWRHHDQPLMICGLVVLALVSAGAIYVAARRS